MYFLSPVAKFTLSFLLLTFVGSILSFSVDGGFKLFGLVGSVATVSYLLFLRYCQPGPCLKTIVSHLERHSLWILAAWMVIYLTWGGLVLFSNPYRYEVNHGDAMFQAQTLWNLVNGLNPENSVYTLNGLFLPNEDPRLLNTYGYVSIFALHQYWLPLLILTPLYAIWPYPPMHTYALQICVIVLGLPGMYWAVRQFGGFRSLAVLAAIGYSLLPQVDVQLFGQGFAESIGLGFMPWLFGALIGRKWVHMCFFALLVALISYPFCWFIIIFGLSALIFFRAIIPGALVILIGWILIKVDTAVYIAAVSPYFASQQDVPSFVKEFVLDRTIGSLIPPLKTCFGYAGYLLLGMGFLPVLALRQNNRWNMSMIGLWTILGGAFSLLVFRTVSWDTQRNSLLIVPLYVMAFIACINLDQRLQNISEHGSAKHCSAPIALLLLSMASMIFLGYPPFRSTPIASHFPWGKSGYVLRSDSTREWDLAFAQLNALVPRDASIAWRSIPEVQAYLANREHSWIVGREPDGIRFFIFLGEPQDITEQRSWKSRIDGLRQRSKFKLLYDGVPGKRLIVFENLDAHPIPRNEELLGWKVLRNVVLRQRSST